ncbi:DUF397 domain-containing protein [Streptomyces sp. RLB1-9]|uniref:DUF397 domain-containing protein n=1 Tax=Streptomyces sp. RLB1-9 TaxID=2594454 RepID=UPI0019672B2C|nr:DUF397 domain-containing protein [Streptomyces sp. RLB1-9]
MEKQYTPWRKSSYSAGSGEACIETRKGTVGADVVDVGVADSKDPARSTVITVSPAAWSSFVASVKG